MSTENHANYDVIIVGAGLVGASFALSLAIHSAENALKVALVEASPAGGAPDLTHFDPRVVALTPHSQQLFETLNVWADMKRQRVSPYMDMQVWDAEGTGRIDFNCGQVQQPCLGHIVENSVVLSSVLDAVEKETSITVLRPAKVEQVLLPHEDSQGEGVTVLLESGEPLRGKLLVAADGAHSRVRELVNLPTREWAYGQKAIVTTVYTEKPHQQTAYQRFLETGPLAFLPLSCEDHRASASSIVWSADESLADQLMALSDDDFCLSLAQSFEHRLGAVTQVEKRYCIPLHQRHATKYFKAGVALIGDAAHTLHPLAGQGVNLGLLDCEVLSEEIVRASKRSIALGDEQILRRFQRRRRGNNLAMMGLMEGFKRLFGSDDVTLRWLRNEGMGTLNNVPLVKNSLIREAMGL